jgi:hypothetical protein
VISNASEPISSIPEIRFATVHDTMNEGAVRPLNILRNGVRGVEVIVPKEDESANQFLAAGRKRRSVKKLYEACVQIARR